MQIRDGVEAVVHGDGPLFIAVGVFDGLHRGHLYLLERLGVEAARRGARPTVITFDHHPDEVLTGHAPPLLLDPEERIDRLSSLGIALTIVVHFDDALRRTTYDAFVERIRDRTGLAGFLMTPDAAFGNERRGTPDALAVMGCRVDPGFDVVVVPPFDLDGRAVRSTDVRSAIGRGDLDEAHRLLGRDVTISGRAGQPDAGGWSRLSFALPLALPPDGSYPGRVEDRMAEAVVEAGAVRLRVGGRTIPSDSRVTMDLSGGS